MKIGLANPRPVCFVANELHELQLGRKLFVPKSALAGFIALVLVWSSTLAFSSTHGRSHRSGSAQGNDQCALCLFAHCQLIAAEAEPGLPLRSALILDYGCPAKERSALASDLRLLPCRAPPFRFSPVVAG